MMHKRGRTRMLLLLLLVASVWKHPDSQYWTACFRDQNGRQRRILTKETDNKKALDTTTRAQQADLIIRSDMAAHEAEHAYNLEPWHPLVHLALASFEKDENQADFLRRYSLDRLPNEPELRQRAAEFLRKPGKRGSCTGSGISRAISTPNHFQRTFSLPYFIPHSPRSDHLKRGEWRIEE